jgi:PIN domain nuclease of toxin-antitoxin system
MKKVSRLLLDTHAFIWWLSGSIRLPATVRSLIAQEDIVVFVSAASAWEIATKSRIGKMPEADGLSDQIPGILQEQGFRPLSVSVADGQRAGLLPSGHQDPFDRMLAAQALGRDMALATADPAFETFGVRVVWG